MWHSVGGKRSGAGALPNEELPPLRPNVIGYAGAQVTFPAWARGHDFLRSSQADCDVTQIRMCVDNQVDALTEMQRQVFDTSATTARNAMWWLQRPGIPQH